MKKREFDKLINSISPKGAFSDAKARALPSETRHSLMLHVVRHRAPVPVALLPDTVDDSWLNAMGYLYRTTSPSTGLVFRHTCEHRIL